jgi:hypothetical protein
LWLQLRPKEVDVLFRQVGGGDEGYSTTGVCGGEDRLDDAAPARDGIVSFGAFCKAVPKLRRHRHRMELEKHKYDDEKTGAAAAQGQRQRGTRERLFLQEREGDSLWLSSLLTPTPVPAPAWASW